MRAEAITKRRRGFYSGGGALQISGIGCARPGDGTAQAVPIAASRIDRSAETVEIGIGDRHD
jgi:hypothetical protein